MKIFLAGASGALGQQLTPRLVQAGHLVGGLTRSPGKTEQTRAREPGGAYESGPRWC